MRPLFPSNWPFCTGFSPFTEHLSIRGEDDNNINPTSPFRDDFGNINVVENFAKSIQHQLEGFNHEGEGDAQYDTDGSSLILTTTPNLTRMILLTGMKTLMTTILPATRGRSVQPIGMDMNLG